jgi:hypothetical protein
VGVGHSVDQIQIVAVLFQVRQVAVDERVEDELAGDADQVERLRPILLEQGAGGGPVLAQHDLLGVAGAVVRVALLGQHRLERFGAGGHAAVPSRPRIWALDRRWRTGPETRRFP